MKGFEKLYHEDVVPTLREKFGLSSLMQVPRIDKIVLNMGVGRLMKDKKALGNAMDKLAMIAGQRPVVCLARCSESGFKIRQGMPVGIKVTLRSKKMWSFFERWVRVAMPRITSFKGYSIRSIQGNKNITIGMHDMSVFPENGYDTERLGMDITVCSNARKREYFQALLEGLEFPFQKEERIYGQ